MFSDACAVGRGAVGQRGATSCRAEVVREPLSRYYELARTPRGSASEAWEFADAELDSRGTVKGAREECRFRANIFRR